LLLERGDIAGEFRKQSVAGRRRLIGWLFGQ
jgi:hypothetical protein